MKSDMTVKADKSICFVANYYKTFFFHEIAARLQTSGIDVCWIVVNRKLRDFLIDKYGADASFVFKQR